MKLNKCNFREIDRKWVLIDKNKDINNIMKKNKIELSFDPVLGLIYIDPIEGLTLRILGNIFKDKNGYSFNEDFINTDIINIRIDKKIKYNITILDDKVASGIQNTNIINDQIDIFYTKKAIIESRKMTELDSFRHKFFPDDIQLYNIKDKDEELIWGRIIDCSLNNKVVVCTLLDDSIINKSYKKDTLVMAKYEKNKKDQYIIIKNSVKKVQKNA